MKKKIYFNILSVSAIFSSFTVSCTEIGTANGDLNAYANKIMENTEFMSKILLANRSENLNVGTQSEMQFLNFLPDSSYNKLLGTKRDELIEVNSNFKKEYTSDTNDKSVSPTALLSAFAGNDDATDVISKTVYDRSLDMDSSSVFEYEMESGPMKTFLKSNSLIKKKNESDNIFNEGMSDNDVYFSNNVSMYDVLSNSNGGLFSNPKIKNIKNMSNFSYGSSTELNFSDDDKNKYSIGQNDINSANLYNFLKQIVGLNELSKSVPLVSNKNNIGNLYTFLNNMFAIDKSADYKVFANLGGTIFSKLYDGVTTGVFSFLGVGIRSLIFDTLFASDQSKKTYYNQDFIEKRQNIVSKNGNDRLNKWFSNFFEGKDKKAWINGRDFSSREAYFDLKYNTLNGDNGGSSAESFNDIMFDLNQTYKNYFDWIDNQTNSEECYQDLNNDLYSKIMSSSSAISSIGKSWSELIENIGQKIKTSSNPSGTLTAKSFIMGLLNIFMLCNSNNPVFQSASSETGLNTVGDIYNLDMTIEKNKAKVYKALGYQNGYIIEGSIFDKLYKAFNDQNNVSYSMMHSIFLDDDSAIKKVLLEDYSSIKNTEMNALFDEETQNTDVNWKFTNPTYDSENKAITYDVEYEGPGDSSFDYSLHKEPLISKVEQKDIKHNKLHTSDNDGIWDYVLNKLDSDTDKYNMKWFVGYDGLGNEYKKTRNSYKITFRNISAMNEKQCWALYSLKWYHDGQQYFNIFE